MWLMKTMRHGCIYCPQQWMLARNNLAQVYLQRELFHLLHKHWINPSSVQSYHLGGHQCHVAPHREGSTLSPLMRPTTSNRQLWDKPQTLQLHDSTTTSSNFKKVSRWQSAYTLVFFDSMFKQDNIGHLPAIAHGGLMKAMLCSCMWIKCKQMEDMLRFRSVAYVYIRSINSLVPLLTE